jgi:2-polyprenyl-6-methoxyphenol hydroxylase-like FAD-dependent oxidoreductase
MRRVVVCGAGISGLTLAHRMHVHGWHVVLLERAPRPREQGYMIDFFGPGYDAAEAMGLLPRVRERAQHISEADYVDGSGRTRASVTFARVAVTEGDRLFSLLRPDLEAVLREQLPAGVDVRYGTGVTEVHDRPGGVDVGLTDGTRLGADLLVGADGIHSTIRRLVFGEEHRFLRYLGFHAAAYQFTDLEAEAATRARIRLTDTPQRQMGFYGLGGGRVAAFAVHRTADPALPRDARAAVRAVYGSLGWIVPRALEACPPAPEVYYDQVAQIEMPGWIRGRVTLVGDACGAVSLLAGQGASLGMAGAYVLAEELAGAPTIEAGLQRYEQTWRPLTTDRQAVGRRTARWFLPSSWTQVRVRRTALRLGHVPGVGRLIVSTVAGKPSAVVTQLAGRS